jgi:dTMP kinase
MNGLLVTFEGSEGAGKTTQIAKLAEHLRASGRTVLLTREPGGTDFGEEVRNILKHAPYGDRLTDEAELLLFIAARAQIVREVIRPALARGEVVLCDRFTDSTLAYQGAGRGIDVNFIRGLNDFATGGLKPHRTYFLDLPVEAGLARAKHRAAANAPTDRMETMNTLFYDRVAWCYRQLAESEPERILTLDATKTPDEIFAYIRADKIFG